ncbi:hypothetical protein BU23DRAFT_183200 [Bimuria novae-zelandiae CBS 107.79]|uniref:Uncharacterized protein n=1 Tax=Bimuria novae-zelandiae CBS 107.79 TaxID=1447943 RepID=A0A6A5V8X4_9PLEO|nr:hypothetical protein BU23DRAFT_183200 [Bimuria novae-zelandiae CBS 107.79]
MKVAVNRKRSRVDLDDDGDQPRQSLPLPSPTLSVGNDALKRSRTQSELEELGVVTPEDAWTVDVASILASNTLPSPPGSSLRPHNNVDKYDARSIIVLCVQGNVRLHYDLLWSTLPQLYSLAPSLQAFVLCRDPSTHKPSSTATYSLPLIQAVGPGYNHFVRLGLLHPLGGGEHPLDALVVIDAQAKRRLVLPFGWGAGKHADTPAGRIVQTRLMDLLRMCVETLAGE